MTAASKTAGRKTDLQLDELLLDPENPRIDAPAEASQAVLRTLLLEREDIIGLANEIIKNGGLMATDSIVVVAEGTKFLVLEGNRRTCACQIIRDPGLIPEKERGRLQPPTDEVRDAVAVLSAVVVPNRDAAMKEIASRHTRRGVRPWRPAAKSRFIGRLYREGRNVEAIRRLMGMGVSQVKRALLDFHLLNTARKSRLLKPAERTGLKSLALKTNAFTRFFTLKEGRRFFPTTVDEAGKLHHPGLSKQEFEAVVGSMAKLYLLPPKGGDEPEYTTRSSADTAIAAAAAGNGTVRNVVNRVEKTPPDQPKPAAKKAKQGRFFENFGCPPSIRRTALIHVANEIAKIPFRKCPMSATFLARLLIEQVMQHCIAHAGLQGKLHAEHGGGPLSPGFQVLLDFVKTNRDQIFRYPGHAIGSLGRIESNKKQLDQVVHGAALPSILALEKIAADSRVFLERILAGDELK